MNDKNLARLSKPYRPMTSGKSDHGIGYGTGGDGEKLKIIAKIFKDDFLYHKISKVLGILKVISV